MKRLKKLLIIFFLFTMYMYILSIQSIPNNIVIFEGETLGLKTILGVKADLTEKGKEIEVLSSNQSKKINSSRKKSSKTKFI